jgi:metallo-beta-lactamase class B
MTRLDKPVITMETIKGMEDMSFFTHALIFDDLLIVAQKETNCFVLKSSEGLIVIDAIWPKEEVFNAINFAITDVGWNPKDIKKLVLTHGHVDHTGCGKWIVDAYHPKTYLSERDDIYWRDEPVKKTRPETWKDYAIDVYINEGDKVMLGDKTLFVYATPGHTPGGLSFIFNVKENEKEHMAALWGGSNPPENIMDIVQYMKSLDHFIDVAEEKSVDIALSNHTSLDLGLERIAYSRKRLSYMPNIYLIGTEGFKNYCQLFRNLCYERLETGN